MTATIPDDVSHVRGRWVAELHDGYVRLSDSDGHLDFHLAWLRDEIGAAGLELDELRVDDGVLRIRWARDQRVSRFPIAWLLANAYAIRRGSIARPPSSVALLELVGDGDLVSIARRALALVDERGAAVIRREGTIDTAAWTLSLSLLGLVPVSTVDPLPQKAVELPAALPAAPDSPRYQVVHVLAATSGDLWLADVPATLAYLGSLDADAAKRLHTTHVPPGRRPHLPFDQVDAWYRARDRFADIVRDPRNHYRIRSRTGDLVIYDRTRMLFGHSAGERAARSITFDADVSG